MKKFNMDELIWFIVLTLINASIIYLVYTSKISFYIGEKMVKYMYATIIILCILTIFQIKNIFTTKSSLSLTVKILPIILSLIIGYIAVTNQSQIVHSELFDNILKKSDQIVTYDISLNQKIVIDDDNIDMLDDIKSNQNKYSGKTVVFDGFVCKEQYLKNNQFLIGRVVITCCGADSKIVGFLVQYDKCNELNENDNIRIEGKIDYTTIYDINGKSYVVPIIKAYSLQTN